MPLDLIIMTGDFLQITQPIAGAMVPTVAAPIPLVGSGQFTDTYMPICIQGDETPKILLAPQPYTAPPFTIPGTGKFTIQLAPNHLTIFTKCLNKPILLKGGPITIIFDVMTPATMPPPVGTPDPMMKKVGTGQFITKNMLVKAE